MNLVPTFRKSSELLRTLGWYTDIVLRGDDLVGDIDPAFEVIPFITEKKN